MMRDGLLSMMALAEQLLRVPPLIVLGAAVLGIYLAVAIGRRLVLIVCGVVVVAVIGVAILPGPRASLKSASEARDPVACLRAALPSWEVVRGRRSAVELVPCRPTADSDRQLG